MKIKNNYNISSEIYDNTLRDGEQTPGLVFSTDDKIKIAELLVELGIKKFEAGFAAVSKYEQKSIEAIVKLNLNAEIFGLSRLLKEEIDLNYDLGLRHLTLFAPSSDMLIQTKFNNNIDKLKQDITNIVSYAKEKNFYIKFSCEDGTRAPIERLIEFYKLAKNAGADIASLPDTCGVSTPEKTSYLVKEIISRTGLPVSIHCHNDFGLATANSLAAVLAGAKEVQTTVNGLGERSGNTPMDELVMALRILYNYDCGLDFQMINRISKEVSILSKREIAVNKPITGLNAFNHESGSHVKSLLDLEEDVYTPFPPSLIGARHSITYGKHSGISNIKYFCKEHDISLNNDQEKTLLDFIKLKSQSEKRNILEEEILNFINKNF